MFRKQRKNQTLLPATIESRNMHAFAMGGVFAAAQADSDPGWTIWQQFRANSTIAADCMLGPLAWCTGSPMQVRLGARTICRGILLCDGGQGSVSIDKLVYIGDNVIISTRERICIGARTLISHGVQIFDNDSHPLDAVERHADYLNLVEGRPRTHVIASAPVEIGVDCWIGMNSLVLKGVRIGDRTIVAAGSVVTANIPADCIVAGNPARVVRSLV